MEGTMAANTIRTDTTEGESVERALRVVTRLRREDLETILALPDAIFHDVLGNELRRAQEAPGCGR